MGASATERALAVPELLTLILSFLAHDKTALRSATRVNTTWNQHAVNELWRHPPCRVLLRVAERRRQRYASAIQKLKFGLSEEFDAHEEYTGLKFARLQCLELKMSLAAGARSPTIGQYLQRNLREFLFHHGHLDQGLARSLPQRCPRLTKVLIGDTGAGVTEEDLIQFFRRLHTLEDVSLGGRQTRQVPDNLFCDLLGREQYKSLVFRGSLRKSAVQRAKETNTKSSDNLLKLGLTLEEAVLRDVISIITTTTLRNMTLVMLTNLDLSILWPLRVLETLDVWYPPHFRRNPPALYITPLTRFPNLRKLRLPLVGSRGLEYVTHEPLCAIFQCLPQLQDVNLTIYERLEGTHFLAALGESCPLLKKITLNANFDLSRLTRFAAPLLPRLQSLWLMAKYHVSEQMGESGEDEGEQRLLAGLLYRHMPRLQCLLLHDPFHYMTAAQHFYWELRHEAEAARGDSLGMIRQG